MSIRAETLSATSARRPTLAEKKGGRKSLSGDADDDKASLVFAAQHGVRLLR